MSARYFGPIFIAICVLAGSWMWASAEPAVENDPTADPIAKLTKRIEALEAQVAKLEANRVQPAITFTRGTSNEIPAPLPKVPGSWSQHQINGLNYYIVPLTHESGK